AAKREAFGAVGARRCRRPGARLSEPNISARARRLIGARLLCASRPIRSFVVRRALIVCAPRAALAQSFRIGAALRRLLAETGEELIAHLGGHEVADRT